MPEQAREEKTSALRLVAATLSYCYRLVWAFKPSFFLLYLLDVAVTAALPFVNIIAPKYLIDELMGGRDMDRIVLFAFLIVAGNALGGIIRVVLTQLKWRMSICTENYFMERLSAKTMEMDFEDTEDPETLDQMQKARQGMSSYSGGISGLTDNFSLILSGVITLAGVVAILVSGAPWLLLVLAATASAEALLNSRLQKREVALHKRLAKLNRADGYINWRLSHFRYGKDIRLYDAADTMVHMARAYHDQSLNQWKNHTNRATVYREGITIVGVIRDFAVYLYIGVLALKKLISIGDFTMYISSGQTFSSSMSLIISNMQNIHKSCCYAYEYVKFMRMETKAAAGGLPLTVKKEHLIEFRDVSFKYPRAGHYVLRHVNLTIRPGEHLAIVGLNGAGKTTLIKLLCRLYDVEEGAILVDGVNIREYDFEEYVKLFSVVFQDFFLLSFTVKENVALYEAEEADGQRVRSALALSGLEERVDAMEKGVDTPIFKQFEEDGVEPSGGEQQKLAIARALYKNAPVVILDEPTAALDPIAEYEIYRQFHQLVGGKTAIYISHRLSSCKFCDKIVVLSGDSVAEYGTHEELAGRENGVYAEMFRAQAQYYVDENPQ